MIAGTVRRAIIGLLFASLAAVGSAGAQDIKLPDMGSPADAILSGTQE